LTAIVVNTEAYSKLVIKSDVFPLLERFKEKKLAFEYSSLKRSTFYDYCHFLPIKSLFQRQKLSKKECVDALKVYEQLKLTVSDQILTSALEEISYSDTFYNDLYEYSDSIVFFKQKLNEIFIKNFHTIDVDGFLLPISRLEGVDLSVEVQFLGISAWSISTCSDKYIKRIQITLPVAHPLRMISRRDIFIKKVISDIFKNIPLEHALQATEILITTKTYYKNLALELLMKGWVNND